VERGGTAEDDAGGAQLGTLDVPAKARRVQLAFTETGAAIFAGPFRRALPGFAPLPWGGSRGEALSPSAAVGQQNRSETWRGRFPAPAGPGVGVLLAEERRVVSFHDHEAALSFAEDEHGDLVGGEAGEAAEFAVELLGEAAGAAGAGVERGPIHRAVSLPATNHWGSMDSESL
jgi:hypothetical protein